MTLGELHALLPAARRLGDPALRFSRVHSDTRSLLPGDLFVALKGERFDAHDHLQAARDAGAAALLVERGLDVAGLPGVQVADSRRALGELAAAWRRGFDIPLIAVAGSNGKTTVTQMLASVLRAWHGDAALATSGNFNNDIGLPLTLLRLRHEAPQHRAAVVELGMNHPGEIARLAAIAAPTVALVNNAQREHQEFMSSVEAVALENGAVIEALPADGVAVFPADDAFAGLWRRLAGACRCCTFALQGSADVSADADWSGDHWRLALRTPAGEARLALFVAGRHNVANALAATACALAACCPLDAVVRGLADFRPVKGRSDLRVVERGGTPMLLIDDSYNANPDSVRAAIDVLATLARPRWLLLGDMGEVGEQGPAFHREVGAYARAQGIERLWTVGEASRHAAQAFGDGRHFDAMAELLAELPQAPPSGAALVKGSRFMKMERAATALADSAAAPGGGHAV